MLQFLSDRASSVPSTKRNLSSLLWVYFSASMFTFITTFNITLILILGEGVLGGGGGMDGEGQNQWLDSVGLIKIVKGNWWQLGFLVFIKCYWIVWTQMLYCAFARQLVFPSACVVRPFFPQEYNPQWRAAVNAVDTVELLKLLDQRFSYFIKQTIFLILIFCVCFETFRVWICSGATA